QHLAEQHAADQAGRARADQSAGAMALAGLLTLRVALLRIPLLRVAALRIPGLRVALLRLVERRLRGLDALRAELADLDGPRHTPLRLPHHAVRTLAVRRVEE